MHEKKLTTDPSIEPTAVGDIYPGMRYAAVLKFHQTGDWAFSLLLCGFAPTPGEASRIIEDVRCHLREYLDNGTYCVGAWHEIVRTRKDLDSFRITPIKRQGG